MKSNPILAIKIDVDTERGTKIGVPNLLNLFANLDIPATFLFSLGPDNTGRAIKRIFRPGFLKKVSRTSVVSTYGLRTLLNGVLLPGPHIGKRHANIMRQVKEQGHEVGIHCYDHIRWQDGLSSMTQEEVFAEFNKATSTFEAIFREPATAAGAAGWQANAKSLAAYDAANLLYGSDGRGSHPFYPQIDGFRYKTLQIPSTLPTLDELIGRPEFPENNLVDYYLSLLQKNFPNIFTIHAELEGMRYLKWFSEFLQAAKECDVRFTKLEDIAHNTLNSGTIIPVCELIQGEIDGRSGTLAMQGKMNDLDSPLT